MKLKFFTMIFCAFTASAIKYVPLQESDIPASALNITYDDKGQWLEITAREWQDVVFTDEGEKHYIYQHGYNYQKQQGFLRTYSNDRKLIHEEYNPSSGGMVSKEELLLAFEIFKKHPSIHEKLIKESLPIYIFGGFGYADQEKKLACYRGQRCVHVFANTDETGIVAHAIIKLNDKSVPYPDFEGEIPQNKKNNIKTKRGN